MSACNGVLILSNKIELSFYDVNYSPLRSKAVVVIDNGLNPDNVKSC